MHSGSVGKNSRVGATAMTKSRERKIRLRRAYEPAEKGDGRRVLVDRLWPRGVAKESLAVDEWNKLVAPSTSLRKWFGHDPAKWEEFRRLYLEELQTPEARAELLRLAKAAHEHPLTLVFAAKDESHTHALVLRDAILKAKG
jgi:uncharacterized protein YeaO (DUF488 family)